MKDLVESGKAHNCLNSDDSIKRYPKIFSIALVLTFIALIAFAAFLISDILSLESNSYYAGSLSALSSLNPLGSGAAMKDRQDEATNLTKEMPQPSMDGSGTAKGALVSGNNTGMNLSPSNLTGSQLNGKSNKTNKTAKRVVVVSTSSGGDSHKTFKKKNVSSKSSPQGAQGTVSPLNGTISPLNSAGKNDSTSSQSSTQSTNHSNLSSNITLNLSSSALEINGTKILSNLSSPEGTDQKSAANLASVPGSSMLVTDITSESISQAEPNYSEINSEDNETSNRAIGSSSIPGNGVQGELVSPESNWSNSGLHNKEGFNSSMEDNALNTSDSLNELAGADSYSIPSGLDKQVVSGGKSSSRFKNAKDQANKRISSRSKSAKSSKKPTPRARPVRTRPTRPARDKSDKSRR